jgi:hypothetical protein
VFAAAPYPEVVVLVVMGEVTVGELWVEGDKSCLLESAVPETK